MVSAQTGSLWPEPPSASRRRPLGYREELAAGTRVYVEATDDGVWRFDHWMHAGRERFALLRCADARCQNLHVCRAERIRIDA